MKIVITTTFLKDFKATIKFRNGLDLFLNKLKDSHLFRLDEELYKFKFYVSNISVRGVIFVNVNDVLIPILIVKKSDKKYGNNLVLNKEIIQILKRKLINMEVDLRDGKFDKYEI